MTICPACDGRGWVVDYPGSGYSYSDFEQAQCERCDCLGFIFDSPEEEWYYKELVELLK